MESTRRKLKRVLFRQAPNLAIFALIAYLAVIRLPAVLDHYSTEGRTAPAFSLPLLDGGTFDSTASAKPLIIVFWATWCGPCTVELSRLNDLVKDRSISGDAVLAISSYENQEIVERTARERDYRFRIGLDSTGDAAGLFKVAGTPTVVFIGKDRRVEWITTGLSPTLGIRARRFLR